MTAPSLSFVLPVYNEAKVLERTFAELIPFAETLGRSFEVVCANDGSTDRTPEILDAAAARDPRIRVFHLERNQGKGAAVRRGMLEAAGEMALFLDADLSTPLEECHGFLGALETYDVVLGNRRSPGSNVTRRQPLVRELLGRGFTLLTRTFLAPGVQDFTCGFKAFRREPARAIFERSVLNGWAFDVEIVVIAQIHHFKLVQVPVGWHDEDDSKVRLFGAVLGSFGELCQIMLNRLRGKYR